MAIRSVPSISGGGASSVSASRRTCRRTSTKSWRSVAWSRARPAWNASLAASRFCRATPRLGHSDRRMRNTSRAAQRPFRSALETTRQSDQRRTIRSSSGFASPCRSRSQAARAVG